MSDNAFAAAIRPQSYASSTTGVKKSVVDSTASPSRTWTAAASSPDSRPTSSGSPCPTSSPGSPASTCSSSPGGILQAHPPPWPYLVSRTDVVAALVMRTSLGAMRLAWPGEWSSGAGGAGLVQGHDDRPG